MIAVSKTHIISDSLPKKNETQKRAKAEAPIGFLDPKTFGQVLYNIVIFSK